MSEQKRIRKREHVKVFFGQNESIIKFLIVFSCIFLIFLVCILSIRIGVIGLTREDFEAQSTQIKLIQVTENDIDVNKNVRLNIFENEKYNNRKIIEPGSYGSYSFMVENNVDYNIKYDILFEEIQSHNINMKYKLKMDNVYIRGDADRFINIENLNVNDVNVTSKSITVFTLEWYWEHDDLNDTYVGSLDTDQLYELDLLIDAEFLN